MIPNWICRPKITETDSSRGKWKTVDQRGDIGSSTQSNKIILSIEKVVKRVRFEFEFAKLNIFIEFITIHTPSLHIIRSALVIKQLIKIERTISITMCMRAYGFTGNIEQKINDFHFRLFCVLFLEHYIMFVSPVRTDTIPSCCLCLLQKQMKTARRISHTRTCNTCATVKQQQESRAPFHSIFKSNIRCSSCCDPVIIPHKRTRAMETTKEKI